MEDRRCVTIIKDTSKDNDDPRSYRPISLLPVLGKALEHMVCSRLGEEIQWNMNKSQHGFTKGKSTITAINELMDWVSSRPEKYVLGIFLDISGAFDNVSWPPTRRHGKIKGISRFNQYDKELSST